MQKSPRPIGRGDSDFNPLAREPLPRGARSYEIRRPVFWLPDQSTPRAFPPSLRFAELRRTSPVWDTCPSVRQWPHRVSSPVTAAGPRRRHTVFPRGRDILSPSGRLVPTFVPRSATSCRPRDDLFLRSSLWFGRLPAPGSLEHLQQKPTPPNPEQQGVPEHPPCARAAMRATHLFPIFQICRRSPPARILFLRAFATPTTQTRAAS
jgi:hypothetical protein